MKGTSHSPPGERELVVTGAVLVGLAAASYGCSFLSLGGAALAVALGIAVVKGTLVVVTFMEMRARPASVQLAMLAAALLLAVMIGLVYADVATRDAPPLAPPRTVPFRPA